MQCIVVVANSINVVVGNIVGTVLLAEMIPTAIEDNELTQNDIQRQLNSALTPSHDQQPNTEKPFSVIVIAYERIMLH